MARAIAQIIAETGVGTVFGVPGQRVLPLFHELVNGLGVTLIVTRHEQGAAFMADLNARVSGFGCCVATSGPGATNLLTGIASAWMDSVPMVAITAQAATDEFGHYGIQEGTGVGRTPDVLAMFAATTKAALRPMTPEEVLPATREAVRLARSGRPGPTHLDIPSDMLRLIQGRLAGYLAAVPTWRNTALHDHPE
ncbi:thiamine pyrophosphate-binding protein [Pseudonocardia sp. ICBG1142]|uniref:thiamine pyrophosphate-binding protein n=1 Tax=Pseudonocardia sp. ICBG1142 TaxID=2846760 RepID=UPI001CF67E4B